MLTLHLMFVRRSLTRRVKVSTSQWRSPTSLKKRLAAMGTAVQYVGANTKRKHVENFWEAVSASDCRNNNYALAQPLRIGSGRKLMKNVGLTLSHWLTKFPRRYFVGELISYNEGRFRGRQMKKCAINRVLLGLTLFATFVSLALAQP